MTQRLPPSPERVAEVFRELSEERAHERASLSVDRDWRRLQHKWQHQIRQRNARGIAPRVAAGLSAVAVAAGVILGVWAWPSQEALSFELRAGEGQTRAVVEGEWIRTGPANAVLDFSDGSEMRVEPHSVLNVDVRGKHSARARLEDGKLAAKVHHADETDWVFVAGPYEVRVVGTQFELAWQNQAFSLVMHEGRVEVLGPEQQRWDLRQGDRLHVDSKELVQGEQEAEAQAAELASATQATAPESSARASGVGARGLDPSSSERGGDAQPSLAPGEQSPERDPQADPAHRSSDKRSDARGPWQSMLAKGKFDTIVTQARGRGLESVLDGSSAGELAALAQAAGYSGEAELAKRTWKTIRSRHAGSASALRGAFFLARLEESRGANRQAVRWLDTYLTEAPRGVLAMEARGRKLVLTRRIHGANSAAARAVARDYLQRYPEGSYAETARATLGHR